jgi:hypothetical protein
VAGVLLGGSCYYSNNDCHDHYDSFHDDHYRHCHNNGHHGDGHHSSSSSQVTVLVTDHPIDDVDAFLVTITNVTFIREDDEPMSVYRSDSGRRIDLLSLRGDHGSQLYDLLATEDLPPGAYDSIQLTVRDPVLFLSSGGMLEGDEIDLVGDGEIEIALSQELILEADRAVHVVLDFDVSSSVFMSEDSDGSPRRGVRPIILVDVLYDDVEDVILTPNDLRGRLRARDPDTELLGLELPNDRGTLELRLLAGPELVDRWSNPVSEDALTPGSNVRVRGYLSNEGELEVESLELEPSASGAENRGRVRNDGYRPSSAEVVAAAAAGPIPTAVQGIVTDVMLGEGSLVLLEADGSRRRIWISPDTTIVFVEASDEGLWQTSAPLWEVEIGMHGVVQGDVGFPARVVVVTAD